MAVQELTSNQKHIVDVLLKKNPALNREILENAIVFIAEAHSGQYRKSGMPYTEHPYEVAKILSDLKQDQATVLAGLLHDVVEDTPHTLSEISPSKRARPPARRKPTASSLPPWRKTPGLS